MLKWLAGMIAGSIKSIVTLDKNEDKKVQASEVLTAFNAILAEAFDDLPTSFDFGKALEEAKDPEVKLSALTEFSTKLELKNKTAERISELLFELLLEVLAMRKGDAEAVEA